MCGSTAEFLASSSSVRHMLLQVSHAPAFGEKLVVLRGLA